MISNLIRILSEVIQEQKELADNILLRSIYNFLINKGDLPDFEVLVAMGGKTGSINEPVLENGFMGADDNIRDLRFKRVMVQGVRKFPSKLENYYGLNFERHGAPVSSVFLGANGVGKSSLYASLEYITLQHIYSAEARGYADMEQQREYLKNTKEASLPNIVLDSLDGRRVIQFNSNSPVGVPAFFCSEYDIQYLERHDVNMDYLYEQVGLSSVSLLIKRLEVALRVRELQQKFDRAKKEYEDLEEELNGKTEFKDRLRNLDYQLNDLSRDFAKLTENENWEIDSFRFPIGWADQASQIINFLNQRIAPYVNQIQGKLKSALPQLLKKSIFYDCDVNVSFEEGKIRIVLLVNGAEGNQVISPRQFLNTFRFKLYCVALKVCLAYCAKTLNRCNFPMVIDDVFDSSDFEQRNSIHRFIEDLVYQHSNLVDAQHYPLQIIFFSQDDLVSEGVYRGIKNALGANSVKYGRIFDCTEYKTTDCEKINVLTTNDLFINLEDSIV